MGEKTIPKQLSGLHPTNTCYTKVEEILQRSLKTWFLLSSVPARRRYSCLKSWKWEFLVLLPFSHPPISTIFLGNKQYLWPRHNQKSLCLVSCPRHLVASKNFDMRTKDLMQIHTQGFQHLFPFMQTPLKLILQATALETNRTCESVSLSWKCWTMSMCPLWTGSNDPNNTFSLCNLFLWSTITFPMEFLNQDHSLHEDQCCL